MELLAHLTASSGLVASGRTRHYFSSEHLWNARDSASRCLALETALQGVRSTDIAHRAACSTSIFASVAFLEAFINEVYEDAADTGEPGVRISGLDAENRNNLATYYADDGKKAGILDKYDQALKIAGHPPFERGKEPFQSVKTLIAWRNALTHFKPTWHGNADTEKFERSMQTSFRPSTLLADHDGSPWFPIKAFGADGAAWAVRTAESFASYWSGLMPVPRTWETDLDAWREQSASSAAGSDN